MRPHPGEGVVKPFVIRLRACIGVLDGRTTKDRFRIARRDGKYNIECAKERGCLKKTS